MSDRGTFVTDYIYCERCLTACKGVLLGNDKFHKGVVVPSWVDGLELPIIAGKIGGLSAGDELVHMEYEIAPLLAPLLCHPVRIAVLADNGEHRVILVEPVKANPIMAAKIAEREREQVNHG